VFDFLKRQLVDVIEGHERPGQLAWRVPFEGHEIQNGAQLTVREGQAVAFMNEGRFGDVFGPGMHVLETGNLPVLTSLMNWDKGFHSPFKSDVLFFSLKEQTGLKWGTAQPVAMRDSEIGPVRLRAFGSYSFKIDNLPPFVDRLFGNLAELTAATLEPQLRAAILTAIATALGSSQTPFLDLAANQQRLSDEIRVEVDKAFERWGLKCLTFFVESISLPDEVLAQLDKASAMRFAGDLDRYTKFQTAEAIEKAAGQDGGVAGIGAGVAAAAALSGAVSQSLAPKQVAAPAEGEDPLLLIEKLHKLVTLGALSQEEYDAKKAELLARIK
jgi:membrane protease subunit (stomatin/prohibitin family)